MANIRFKSYDQHQQSFFPLRLDEKISESHLPRLINRFRSKRMKEQVNSLFVQVVMLLVEMGQISLDVQYIDGTKIESVANRYTFVWRKSTEKNKEKLEEKIRGILSQIDEGIVQDNKPAVKVLPGQPAVPPRPLKNCGNSAVSLLLPRISIWTSFFLVQREIRM